MKDKRLLIICRTCLKTKPHFGLGYCSACLRHHKRRTRPSFYLGTCYSEIRRRVTTFDKKRPNYYQLPICTREEFFFRFLKDRVFLRLWRLWRRKQYKRKHAPSIDRIDNTKGYLIENLQFISHSDNSKKDSSYKVGIYQDGHLVKILESQADVARYLKTQPSVICLALQGSGKYKTYYLERLP